MRFGIVILPQYDWPEAARLWKGAEQYGFDHAWTYDHLAWRSLAGEPWWATVPTLTAAAMVTERIGLGTFVASPNYRHPVPFAKDVATVDQISGGRLILGLGSGGTGFDAHVLGQPSYLPRERFERFSEFASALDVLLRFEPEGAEGIDIHGGWYTADHARMVGAPAQRPRMPFIMAGDGPRSARLAARLGDGWVTTGGDDADAEDWWRRVAWLSERFSMACREEGRDPAEPARVLSIDAAGRYSLTDAGAFEAAVERARALGFTDVVAHWPRADGIYAGSEDVLAAVADRLPGLR